MTLHREWCNGPKTKPHEVDSMSANQFPVLLACRLAGKYEENQLNAVSYGTMLINV